MFKHIVESYFGPYKNFWGYITELAVIDDTMITKVRTPYSRDVEVRYFFDEHDLCEYLKLINEDRRF